MKFTKKDNIIIIGAGKISYSLTPALSEAGYNIKSIISRNIKVAEELARKNNISGFSDSTDSLDLKRGIFILAVPDNQIRIAAEKVSKLKIDFPNSLVIHLSGTNDISLLKSVSGKKAHTASFHIMQTFPSRRKRNIKNSFAAIETKSNEAYKYLIKLSEELQLNPFRIDSEKKAIYHIAAVFASNFINAVLLNSKKLFDELKLKEYSFNEIFSPLYSATVKNIRTSGPVEALSGPVERGDLATIKKHIRELNKFSINYPEFLSTYLSLSLTLTEATSMKSTKLKDSQKEIMVFLRNELNKLKYK
jgi:predicted short-subunit dehydrogenase-like oxidoreductase (DUF2520 family)